MLRTQNFTTFQGLDIIYEHQETKFQPEFEKQQEASKRVQDIMNHLNMVKAAGLYLHIEDDE